MLANEPNEKEYIWNRLQEPARPVKFPAAYFLLLAALDTGWQVLEPVRLSSDWEPNGDLVYHILLHRSPSTGIRLLTVSAGPEIEQFLREEDLKVSNGSLSLFIDTPLYLS